MAKDKIISSIRFKTSGSNTPPVAIIEYAVDTDTLPQKTVLVPMPLSKVKDEISKFLPDNEAATNQIKKLLIAASDGNIATDYSSDDEKKNIVFQNFAHARLVAIVNSMTNKGEYIIVSARDYNKRIKLLTTTDQTNPLDIYVPTVVNIIRVHNTHNSQWTPSLNDLNNQGSSFSFNGYGLTYTKTPASEVTLNTNVRVPILPNIYSASAGNPFQGCTGGTMRTGYSLSELIDFDTIFLGNKFNDDLTSLSSVKRLYDNDQKYIFESDDYNLTPALPIKQMIKTMKLGRNN